DPKPGTLDRLCREHGGRLLGSLSQLADLNLAPTKTSRPLWPVLLLAAVVLWLAEVIVSRARRD
ncbi:MAG: hypothetical protein PHU85_03265, partial [Phycisphaerae bacterium]|nr:hypothetical protein [Phycisphaerae bacterium]